MKDTDTLGREYRLTRLGRKVAFVIVCDGGAVSGPFRKKGDAIIFGSQKELINPYLEVIEDRPGALSDLVEILGRYNGKGKLYDT